MTVCCSSKWWTNLAKHNRIVGFVVRNSITYLALGNWMSGHKALFSVVNTNKESFDMRIAFSGMATKTAELNWDADEWHVHELSLDTFHRICIHILGRDLPQECAECAKVVDLFDPSDSSDDEDHGHDTDSFVVSDDEEEPERKRSRQ